MKQRGQAILALASAPALALLTPDGAGVTAPLVTSVAVAAWVCTGWLLLVALLEHGARLPGTAGRLAASLVRRIAPSSVRALVRMAAGASLAASVLAGPAALADDRTPTVAGSSADSLDWPGLAPVAAPPVPAAPVAPAGPLVPVTTTATSAPRPSDVPPPPRDAAPGGQVVVQRGDSLWAIARHSLGPSATARQVAEAWPQWWAANRSVVGDHPDLIHPGDRLSAP
ncbi:MAG: LysM peptidoglycan-binding domain-containing protein [Mycobacteriales bacterium]